MKTRGRLNKNALYSAVLIIAGVVGAQSAGAQTDAALSLYGAFTGTTSANGTTQSPANAPGVLLELRHLSNPLVGYELAYSFNRADQDYGLSTIVPSIRNVKARANQIEASWVVSLGVYNLKAFALAGGGLKFFSTSSGQAGVRGETKPVFVYGAGLDYTVIPHLGLRFQYRGNLYRAPDLANAFSSTKNFARTSEPSLGAYVRF
jgi:opacity protein-like surface antigen